MNNLLTIHFSRCKNGRNKTCRPSDEARAAGWCKIVLSQFIVKAIYCECKLLGQFGDAVDADIEQGSGDNFGLMEVTVPDKLSVSAWQVVVHRYPALGEKIRIGTIPYELRGFMGLRNFFMDTEDGERLAQANSVWSLINHKKGVPVRVLPEMVEKYDVKERLQMDYAPRKIAVPQGGIRQEPFRVERQHLDGNHHVNNGQYISMAMAYLPENFAIRQMRAEYKKSALLHDIVVPIIVTEADRVTVSLCSEDESPFVIVELTGR